MNIIELPYIYQMEAIKKNGRRSYMFDVITTSCFEIGQIDKEHQGITRIEWKNSFVPDPVINMKKYYDFSNNETYRVPIIDPSDRHAFFFSKPELYELNASDLQDKYKILQEAYAAENGLLKSALSFYQLQKNHLSFELVTDRDGFQLDEEKRNRLNEDNCDLKKIISSNKDYHYNLTQKQADHMMLSSEGTFLFKDSKNYYINLKLDNSFNEPVPTSCSINISATEKTTLSYLSFPCEMLEAIRIFIDKADMKLNIENEEGYISVSNLSEEMYITALRECLKSAYVFIMEANDIYGEGRTETPLIPGFDFHFFGAEITLEEFIEWFDNIKQINQSYLDIDFPIRQRNEKESQTCLQSVYNLVSLWTEALLEADYNIKNGMAVDYLDKNGFRKVEETQELQVTSPGM